jgi:hypothetical protein
MLRQLPPAMFPLTVGAAEEMGGYGSEAHYELVLDQLLSGLRR